MLNTRKKKTIKIGIIIATLFLIFFSLIGFFRNEYAPYRMQNQDNKEGVHIMSSKNEEIDNPICSEFKYDFSDDLIHAQKNFDDSGWPSTSTALDIKSSEEINFRGIIWFRCTFRIDDALLNKTYSLKFNHLGASEIYLDGNLLQKFGNVSTNTEYERTMRPSRPVLFHLNDTLEHTLAIRYSNLAWKKNFEKFHEEHVGIIINFLPDQQTLFNEAQGIEMVLFFFTILFGFFITLSLVHFLIFIFYRQSIENLYYSVFVFVFGVLALIPHLYLKTESPSNWLFYKQNIIYIVVLFFLSIVACLHAMFKPSLWKRMFVIQAILCVAIVVAHFYHEIELELNLIFSLILFAVIESIRTVIFGIRKKFAGAGIVGAGVLLFFLFITVFCIDVIITERISLTGNSSPYLIFLIFVAIISIPLSMSIYLARRFSQTNKNLESKLTEVKELSARSLEQEKEKQHILENQKALLETQVTERTHEINEQKKIIEEKNKDIIDSITYAKRIQTAMLPDEKIFSDIFKDAFVLYEPRDIVSGDFYYAAQTKEGKLLIAADCTGHGVPGALMSMVGSNIINKLVHENKISNPKTILENLHKELRHALKQDAEGSANRDGMDISAVLITESEIMYAAANRPLIFFTKENELKELKPDKTPVGGSHIEKVELALQILSRNTVKELFLFSDGFADQFGGPNGKKLMVSRFKKWLEEVIDLTPDQQKQTLSQKFYEWKQQTEQVDDVMVIGIIA
jgi:serine phosphatase RsbU (regulator of sigma subunit)